MDKVTVEMPRVKQCSATQCGYNVNHGCHAKAITVGDATNPECDTFFQSKTHNREAKRKAGVGACKVSACKHNEDFECMADGISVGSADSTVKCLTYAARSAAIAG